MHFTEYDTRLAAYAVLVNDRREILLTWFNGGLDPRNACWSLPGGGVDFDEGIEDAAVREAYEETGYLVELDSLLAIHHLTGTVGNASPRPFRSQRFVFTAHIVGGRLGTVEVGGSTDLARWLPLGEYPFDDPVSDILDVAVGALTAPRG